MSQNEDGPVKGADKAFGAANRARLLERYFHDGVREPVSPDSAWRHVYRLLMWIDRTIGLAHCYESDKCQPGRPWYARSLAFHDYLSREFRVAPEDLSHEVDWLFKSAVVDLARAFEANQDARLQRAAEQRAPYLDVGMPVPGADAELEALIESAIRDELGVEAPEQFTRHLSERIQSYVSSENKRKNLVGEGFEDTLASLLERLEYVVGVYDVYVRPPLHDLPGFHPPRGGDKTKKVDLAMVRRQDGRRILISCKWSIRSDREEQFATDFEAYANLESSGQTFDYVLVTNEFDPARLAAACDNRRQNSEIFTHVVHVNPDGPRAAYAAPTGRGRSVRDGRERALAHMGSERLTSLSSWLASLEV